MYSREVRQIGQAAVKVKIHFYVVNSNLAGN